MDPVRPIDQKTIVLLDQGTDPMGWNDLYKLNSIIYILIL